MTDHKFTGDDVIETLKNAKYKVDGVVTRGYYLSPETFNAVVDLIGRQKAEIERLNGIVAEKSKNITYAAKELIRLDRERSEVIKEFANNVVQELWKLNWHYGQLPCSEEDKTIQRAIKECIAVVERNTKVMTEGNHESQNT